MAAIIDGLYVNDVMEVEQVVLDSTEIYLNTGLMTGYKNYLQKDEIVHLKYTQNG